MHLGNREWLAALSEEYPFAFYGAAVLEIGSGYINGTARDYFKKARKYVGVDCAPYPCVDLVCKAAETRFRAGEFDTLVCLSLFEHDPDWRQSFSHNLQWIRKDGHVFVCWGAEGNLHHGPEPWKPVPLADFVRAAENWPIETLDSFWECDRYTADCPGAYNLVAVKI